MCDTHLSGIRRGARIVALMSREVQMAHCDGVVDDVESVTMTADVFLSYSHDDSAVAQEMKVQLRANGIDVFDVSEIPPGSLWVDAVHKAIKASTALVAIISRNYSSSTYTTLEWSNAFAEDKVIVPVLVESKVHVPALLAPYQGIDASDPATRHEALSKLAQQISALSASEKESLEGDIDLMRENLVEFRRQNSTTIDLVVGILSSTRRTSNLIIVIMAAATALLAFIAFVVFLVVSAPAREGMLGAFLAALVGLAVGVIGGVSPQFTKGLRGFLIGKRGEPSRIDAVDSDPRRSREGEVRR